MLDDAPLEEQKVEFTDRQIEQLDAIDNSVYQTILIFLNKTEDAFPWDMCYIGQVAEAIEEVLLNLGQRVYRPSIITEKDGSMHLEEYLEPEPPPSHTKNKKKEKSAYER